MFKEKNDDSKMESKEDKPTRPIFAGIKKNSSFVEGWLRSSVRKVKEILYSDPLGLNGELKYHRHFLWKVAINPSEDYIKPIAFYLSQFGIYFRKRSSSAYNYRHLFAPIHITVKPEFGKFRINAHIDTIPHEDVRYSYFTSILLSELSMYLKMLYKNSKTSFYDPLVREQQQEDSELEIIAPKDDLPIEITEDKHNIIEESSNLTEKIDRTQYELNDTIKKSKLYIKHLLYQYESRRKYLISVRRERELAKLAREDQYQLKIEQLDLFKAEWNQICKVIIDVGFEEELAELSSEDLFSIDPQAVENRIREIMSKILEDINIECLGFLLLEFSNALKTYFPLKLAEMQKLLDTKREKIEFEKEEKKRLTMDYIDMFLNIMSKDILKLAIDKNLRDLKTLPLENLITEFFNVKLIEDDIIDKEFYYNQFEERITSNLNDLTRNIERDLRRYEESIKKVEIYRFSDWLQESKSNAICFVIIMGISVTLLCIFMLWSMTPRLELYTYWAENLWIAPLLSSIVAIEVILLIVVLVSFKDRRTSHRN